MAITGPFLSGDIPFVCVLCSGGELTGTGAVKKILIK